MEVRHSWWHGLIHGYGFRVTSLHYSSHFDGQICTTDNLLYEFEESGFYAPDYQIKDTILDWLIDSGIAWKAERRGVKSGIWFRRKQDVILFKLVWG